MTRHHSRRHQVRISRSEVIGWVKGSLPDDLYAGEGPVTVEVDGSEILVVGDVGAPDTSGLDEDQTARAAAAEARIDAFREATRDRRIGIAQQAERRYGLTISWGARSGETTRLFTTVYAPVGTRLPMAQRKLLDSLVEAGIAADRADALAWCVRLVEQNEEAWVERLKSALADVKAAADDAPGAA
jgi:hypothetical protein